MKQRVAAMVLAGWMVAGACPLWAAEPVELSTRVSGVVETVWVKPGQRVKKGTLLLRLDRRCCRRTSLKQRPSRRVRRPMQAKPGASGSGRRNCLSAPCHRPVNSMRPRCWMRVRRRRLPSREARRVIAQKNLQDAELKAPLDGVVSAVPGGPGTVVAADCQPKPCESAVCWLGSGAGRLPVTGNVAWPCGCAYASGVLAAQATPEPVALAQAVRFVPQRAMFQRAVSRRGRRSHCLASQGLDEAVLQEIVHHGFQLGVIGQFAAQLAE